MKISLKKLYDTWKTTWYDGLSYYFDFDPPLLDKNNGLAETKSSEMSPSSPLKIAVLGDSMNGKSILINLITDDHRKDVNPKVWNIKDDCEIQVYEIPSYLGKFKNANEFWNKHKLYTFNAIVIATECRFDTLNILWTFNANANKIPLFIDNIIEKLIIQDNLVFENAVRFVKKRDEKDLTRLINYDNEGAMKIRSDPSQISKVFGPTGELSLNIYQITEYKELNEHIYNNLDLEKMKNDIYSILCDIKEPQSPSFIEIITARLNKYLL
eukprot:NODE_259_length_11524_cov_0.251028.p2 type:complete len:269 gc:universal NODE_259_length_11524_cov_0.251028:496-1302(+)